MKKLSRMFGGAGKKACMGAVERKDLEEQMYYWRRLGVTKGELTERNGE